MKRIDIEVSGGCQCGAVRYRATQMLDNAHLCHCRMCQKAVGNIFAALVAAPNEALRWTRGAPSVWRSSEHVERGFCGKCGTPIFYNDVTNDRINLTIGSLDDPAAFPPLAQFGSESRVRWFSGIEGIEDGGPTGSGEPDEWLAAIAASNHQHPDDDTAVWPN
jgi:hypothetical protein